MSSLGKTFLAMASIAFLGFAAWIFNVDFQLMLLLSIAYDLTYMKIDKEYERH